MNVRFGIIGLGRISTRFATALNTVAGTELTAVAARDQARADEFAHKFGAKKAYASYADLIADKDVDVVYIGLTHNFHYEITKLCLEQHQAVLCEKPFVTNSKDALELVALARQNQTFLMEAMWTRCMPAFRKAKEWIADGRIGQVKLIQADFCYRSEYDPENRLFNPKLAGGSLFDVGIYPLDFAIGIMGEYPQAITGLAHLAPTGIDELDAFTLDFASGALASLTCGFTVNAANEAVIYGTKGRLILQNCYGPQYCDLYDGSNKRVAHFEKPVPDGFVYQIEHCADLIRHGKLESDLIPLEDTLYSASVFDTLLKQWGVI